MELRPPACVVLPESAFRCVFLAVSSLRSGRAVLRPLGLSLRPAGLSLRPAANPSLMGKRGEAGPRWAHAPAELVVWYWAVAAVGAVIGEALTAVHLGPLLI